MSVLQKDIMKIGRIFLGEFFDVEIKGINLNSLYMAAGTGNVDAKAFENRMWKGKDAKTAHEHLYDLIVNAEMPEADEYINRRILYIVERRAYDQCIPREGLCRMSYVKDYNKPTVNLCFDYAKTPGGPKESVLFCTITLTPKD